MTDNQSNNKRLAKNTMMLYFRMVFLMIVTLYTSRVTLNVLGVEDFGIYNIIGGVVVLFTFISRALNGACNRFFSYTIETGDQLEIQKVFSTALVVHVLLIFIIVFLLETIGLWFVINKINIPEERQSAAYIIYQIAILSTCLNLFRTPFNSSIIANERMSFYAYTSIVEGLLKLIIVWLLYIIPKDKLITYSMLLAITILAINLWYIFYCERNFLGNRLIFRSDKKTMKEMLSFNGWSMLNGVADIGWQQGTNIILNLFYGVKLNAVMGITNQIRNALFSFVGNLQIASNPQIIKAYATKDYHRFESLILRISKYSFYLMLFFAIPMILNAKFILKIWLNNVPEHAENFAILILVFCLFDSLVSPLLYGNQATGKIKNYSLLVSCILLLNIPVTYILFKCNYPPESMLLARIIIVCISVLVQLLYSQKSININFTKYAKFVIAPIILVSAISFCTTFYAVNDMIGWSRLIASLIISTLIITLCIFLFGISPLEKGILYAYIKNKTKKTRQ